jgi:hypothetical protein
VIEQSKSYLAGYSFIKHDFIHETLRAPLFLSSNIPK